VGLARTWM